MLSTSTEAHRLFKAQVAGVNVEDAKWKSVSGSELGDLQDNALQDDIEDNALQDNDL